jgi:hypothetical protein
MTSKGHYTRPKMTEVETAWSSHIPVALYSYLTMVTYVSLGKIILPVVGYRSQHVNSVLWDIKGAL